MSWQTRCQTLGRELWFGGFPLLPTIPALPSASAITLQEGSSFARIATISAYLALSWR